MLNYTLSYAQESDLQDLFEVVNDPVIRQNSFNSNAVSFSDHTKWFEGKLKDQNCYFYVVRADRDFVGSIRFDLDDHQRFIVSMQIAKNFRGKNLASAIIIDGTLKLLSQKKDAKIFAYIKEDNPKSLHVFMKSGYEIIGKLLKGNVDTFFLEYKNANK